MLSKIVKRFGRLSVSVTLPLLAAGIGGSATANDAPIITLLTASDVNLQELLAYTDSTKNRPNQTHYTLPNGTSFLFLGPNTKNINQVEKMRVVFGNDVVEFEKAVSALTNLLGKPRSSRRDLLIWETPNIHNSGNQSKAIEIIAGSHGADKFAISINRQGKQYGNNKSAKSESEPKKNIQKRTIKSSKTKPNASAF